jgi:membrane protein YqaA with SNARE-associated domain
VIAEIVSLGGLPALFLLSFLAATLFPVGSEWLLVMLILEGREPLFPVIVATLGNTLGACTTYLIGLFGASFLVEKVWRVDEGGRARAERLYTRFGAWSLLLSWVPVIGDPLCLAGGFLRVPFPRFLLFVSAGKLARYAVVAAMAGHGERLLG